MMALIAVAAIVLLLATAGAMAEPTFTSYQGMLEKDGAPFTGTAEMKFVIVDAATGTSLWSNDGSSTGGSEPTNGVDIPVTEGIFTVFLGMSPMTPIVPEDLVGSDEPVLRIWVDTGDGIEQLDDQPIGGALYSMAAVAGQYWSLTGNAGTTDSNYLGTSDERRLCVRVGGRDILRLKPTGETEGVPNPGNIIGGWGGNSVREDVIGATISGGGRDGELNKVTDDLGTVGGGHGNIAGNENPDLQDAMSAAVGGGMNNEARHSYATISGGANNTSTGILGAVAGGLGNKAAEYGAVGGGGYNEASGQYSAIAGGSGNAASGAWGTVPGGYECRATGDYAFAAGFRARAMEEGSFVWADKSSSSTCASWGENSMRIRASGGIFIADSNTDNRIRLLPETGTIRTESLVITAGTDLAEPFEMSDAEHLPEGSVVVIDENQPGRLKLSQQAYDHRVAGIISGAGGIQPGVMLQQDECVGDAQHVALTGRAYVRADASDHPIRPGDLLTTSDMPGHAMKAVDASRRSGAVIGKAMSSLDSGTGLVLVLISLQ
ncbi:MAG: hypothetical protein GF355_04580 [Candidatus Eisenbacteria bacterium]|nr:hypothetical protein [Candidatus Eisenbacteria bacterium]